MLFSSITFLFAFLPAVLLGHFLLPRYARNSWLLVCSLIFYTWGEKAFALLMVGSIVIVGISSSTVIKIGCVVV